MSSKKASGFIMQAIIFSVIMIVSNFIASKLPIPMPASVIGMIILFILLCTKAVKLEQVEDLGMALNSKIGFFFVPAGISVINSLGLMQKYGIAICLVIFAATVILLGVTGLFSDMLLKHSEIHSKDKNKAAIDDKVGLGSESRGYRTKKEVI
ncbi:antiholin-like protein LrgA [Clostridium pasteurianum DSM 525 = ATCC 6013]|uniref:Antiholin-like protein LrgA n=1 Tax=Clostridium pasteurianum DSM 525 = ATCC 6013 TaxID=1262449 RepID=A0A0H3JA32_CLOPA|nr:antiholin-like murein hydrolase modulator LrgA [Clostridium pasteurianum]AJA49198.1 antiholin-like protein LrgA [Clostridium pasteurianum DSM 525 = ATCC 6013]AJA53186.1 antiholin-like protein LrgA [Clostridium pasteurianum DSM 525 = ATCC 6013]AOZ76380.1 murein hydrolase transporter LrgA [Clostridium pasteurianum DSM 525 = ATCC 6013]AOZ80177.1 murein hydrolase transporter LrgA [Clostridium pasteurianum]ELP59131.1 murein hydrolase regulator LrgA [Clostridium pasteurianum DSM 525 = ATCC 6013]